jgi:hypothetical protein
VVGNGRVDVNGIDIRVGEDLFELGIADIDLPVITALLQLVGVALADGVAVGVGVLLPDGDELGSESEADDCDVDFLAHVIGKGAAIAP